MPMFTLVVVSEDTKMFFVALSKMPTVISDVNLSSLCRNVFRSLGTIHDILASSPWFILCLMRIQNFFVWISNGCWFWKSWITIIDNLERGERKIFFPFIEKSFRNLESRKVRLPLVLRWHPQKSVRTAWTAACWTLLAVVEISFHGFLENNRFAQMWDFQAMFTFLALICSCSARFTAFYSGSLGILQSQSHFHYLFANHFSNSFSLLPRGLVCALFHFRGSTSHLKWMKI